MPVKVMHTDRRSGEVPSVMRFGCITGSGTSERIDVRAWWIDVRDDPPQLDMQPSCITAAAPAPRRRIRINGARESNGRRAAPWPAQTPRGRSTSPRASGQLRRNSSIFGCGAQCVRCALFGCSSVVLQLSRSADRRPATVAGSVVARHPAGGSTRRRSMVLMSGGPFRAEDTVGAPLKGATCHPT